MSWETRWFSDDMLIVLNTDLGDSGFAPVAKPEYGMNISRTYQQPEVDRMLQSIAEMTCDDIREMADRIRTL